MAGPISKRFFSRRSTLSQTAPLSRRLRPRAKRQLRLKKETEINCRAPFWNRQGRRTKTRGSIIPQNPCPPGAHRKSVQRSVTLAQYAASTHEAGPSSRASVSLLPNNSGHCGAWHSALHCPGISSKRNEHGTGWIKKLRALDESPIEPPNANSFTIPKNCPAAFSASTPPPPPDSPHTCQSARFRTPKSVNSPGDTRLM